jgi:hypothetical protein
MITKNIMKHLILIPGLFLICSLSNCTVSRPVVEIGEAKITNADISYRMAIGQISGNENIAEVSVLVQLISKGLEYEVARLNGITVSPDEIQDFSNHVDSSTKAPKLLAKIKELFKGDESEYGRVYLMPIIINHKLHEWFNRDQEIHKNERAAIEKAQFLIKSGKTLEQAAQLCSLKYISQVDSGLSDIPTIPINRPPSILRGPLADIFKSLAKGEIYKDIIEDDFTYKIVRLVDRNGAINTIEMLCIDKRPFTEWFEEQAKKIPLVFHDQKRKKSIIEKYPQLWWVKKLSE